jgi:UDP-glucuronate 4-epimerase
MKFVLVTGGAGFIGSQLCEKLIDMGYYVVNIDNFNDYYNPHIKLINITNAQKFTNYSIIRGDIRNNDILDKVFTKYKIDMVIHLAALAGVRNSIESPNEYIDVDIRGTVNLLEHCRKYDIKKLVFASSSSVYGIREMPFTEDLNIDSQASIYAAAKAAGELCCRTYNNLYGIEIICLRFFTVYGPRQRPEMAIHKFTRLIDEDKEIMIFGNGSTSRDYTYIDDIINGIVLACDYDCNFEIFNLGNSMTVSINELIELIEKKLGKEANKKYVSIQNGDVINTCADISKARRLLNFIPQVSIEAGIERFVNWYKLNKDIYK